METIATTYAKAVDDLSAKIFVPGLICSLWIEFGPIILEKTGLGFLLAYCVIFLIGFLLAFGIIYFINLIDIYLFGSFSCIPYIGVFIMPLGIAGLFPEQFNALDVPYSQVTGVALLAWSFMLLKNHQFFKKLFYWIS